jgi:hypothetical protein
LTAKLDPGDSTSFESRSKRSIADDDHLESFRSDSLPGINQLIDSLLY